MNKNKKLGFTLAEVLIVIGIIGVVAALTLPNLNHATGDKETVTRLKKFHAAINEANDRAVAIYGPLSEWKSNEQCANDPATCWMKRIGEFLKISKSCDESESAYESGTAVSCESIRKGEMAETWDFGVFMYQLADGSTFGVGGGSFDCNYGFFETSTVRDLCLDWIVVDINGPNKGNNGNDLFQFAVSDSIGFIPEKRGDNDASALTNCLQWHSLCSWWVLEFDNLDYLKADEEGKCNDSNIILDGVTNTSCH